MIITDSVQEKLKIFLKYAEIKDNKKKDTSNEKIQQKKLPTVFYEITFDSPFMKCPRFYIKKDGKVIYMAKQKNT